MSWLLALLGLGVLISLPYLLEATRKPVDPTGDGEGNSEFAELHEGTTHFQWHGNKGGRVLVMVHGLSTPSWVFSGLIPAFNMMGYSVLTYDLYGRGLSARPDGSQDKDFFVDQLHDLLEDQALERDITLFGYSMGGAIATAFAAGEPERVERLILLAPAGIDYTPAPLLAMAAEWGRPGEWLWGLLGAWHLRRGAAADARRPTILPDLISRMRKETSRKGYLPAVLSSERNMLSEVLGDEHRALAQSNVAVVAIWGEHDDVIPISSVGKLTEWNREAYQYVIPGAVHSLGYTNPKEVVAAVHEHLREV